MNWLKQFFSRKRPYAELDEEVASRLKHRVEDLVAEGTNKEEVLAEARKELGNVMAIKQTARAAWGWKRIEDLLVDLRFGLRMLKKNPVLTLAAVLTLALGVGANTAIFTLLYGLLLRSLPASNPGQLARVGVASRAEPDDANDFGSAMTYHVLETYREEQTSFRQLSSWDNGEVLVADKQGVLQRYMSEMVSRNAFELLGLQPYRGRLIAPYDDVKGGPGTGWPVAIRRGDLRCLRKFRSWTTTRCGQRSLGAKLSESGPCLGAKPCKSSILGRLQCPALPPNRSSTSFLLLPIRPTNVRMCRS